MLDPVLWLAFVAIVLGAFFATLHAALKTFSRSRLADLLEQRQKTDALEPLLKRLSDMQLVTGILRTVANFLLLLAALDLVQQQRQWGAFLGISIGAMVALLIVAVIVSVTSVALPVFVARYHAERILLLSRTLLHVVVSLFRPVLLVLGALEPVVRRISGVNENEYTDELSDQIRSVVEEHDDSGQVDDEQKDMLEAVVELPQIAAGQIMTPRTDVKGIDIASTFADIKSTILTCGFSRYPVYRENLDDIVGVLYAKDLIRFLGTDQQLDLESVLRDALMVPSSKSVHELLAEFKARKVHIAIVLDEYGGTAGLVTIEDILEEIVGEIQDEYETEDETPMIRPIDEHSAEIDARAYIDDLNDELDLDLPEDEDFETMGGFVFATLGHIPVVGESFDYDNLRVTVTEAARTKVITVRLDKLDGQATSGDADQRQVQKAGKGTDANGRNGSR